MRCSRCLTSPSAGCTPGRGVTTTASSASWRPSSCGRLAAACHTSSPMSPFVTTQPLSKWYELIQEISTYTLSIKKYFTNITLGHWCVRQRCGAGRELQGTLREDRHCVRLPLPVGGRGHRLRLRQALLQEHREGHRGPPGLLHTQECATRM